MPGGDCGTQLFDLKVTLKINEKRCHVCGGSSQTFGFQSQCQVEFELDGKRLGPQEESFQFEMKVDIWRIKLTLKNDYIL